MILSARSPLSVELESFLETFFEEAEEHLALFEGGLLALETAPADPEIIARVFRAAHSIKGASATFGLHDVAAFTHALEGVLDRLRSRALPYDRALAGLLLEALDMLRAVIEAARCGTGRPAGEPPLRERLAGLLGSESAPVLSSIPAATSERVWCVSFAPNPEFMARGMDPVLLLRELTEMGDVESLELDASAMPALEDLDPESCFLRWTLRVRTACPEADLRDVFSFAQGLCLVAIQELRQPSGLPAVADESPCSSAATPTAAATIRVSTEKLDKLLDLVGELAIAHATLVDAARESQATRGSGGAPLEEALAAMARHTRELQEGILSVRMVPLATVFRRLPRLVHDLAAACGKRARLQIEGEETEIDKGMVEQLVDPLTHLVRNAIDHGLELPEDRRAAGKPEEGTVRVRALHHGGNVVIEVVDDGRGLPTDAIRTKAIGLGLIAADAQLTDAQLHDLVFRPGFSTAAMATDVSGRGVGMDVVKQNVEGLSGSLRLASRAGHGTEMTLRLPLTLAILDGLSVKVGPQTFVIPLLSVVESFRPTRSQVRGVLGVRAVIDVRGSLPLVRLHEILGIDGAETDPCAGIVCVLENSGGPLALFVDELVGQVQVVVKNLELGFAANAFMGATILGNGRVAMILDVQALSRAAASSSAHSDCVARPVETNKEAA